jgi:hypothetical protein
VPDVPQVRLTWFGRDIESQLLGVVPKAMDDTTAAAAIRAKQSHPGWKNVTGTAEGSIRGDPAKRFSSGWRALFGSFDVAYFIWLEIGARGRAGDHTIRRAADIEFPSLGRRIRDLASLGKRR